MIEDRDGILVTSESFYTKLQDITNKIRKSNLNADEIEEIDWAMR